MTVELALSGFGLASWLYLLLARGGFWRANIREEESLPLLLPRNGLRSSQSYPRAMKPMSSRKASQACSTRTTQNP